ncbi:hypothetical protein MTO96_041629 [Rhipicephalus appendiculatus]
MLLRLQDLDETLYERLWGLTEMFPPKLRQGVCDVAHFSWGSARGLYSFGRSAFWIIFSSSAILCARHLRAGATAGGGDESATAAPDSTGSKCSCVWWCTTWHDASNWSRTAATEVKSWCRRTHSSNGEGQWLFVERAKSKILDVVPGWKLQRSKMTGYDMFLS